VVLKSDSEINRAQVSTVIFLVFFTFLMLVCTMGLFFKFWKRTFNSKKVFENDRFKINKFQIKDSVALHFIQDNLIEHDNVGLVVSLSERFITDIPYLGDALADYLTLNQKSLNKFSQDGVVANWTFHRSDMTYSLVSDRLGLEDYLTFLGELLNLKKFDRNLKILWERRVMNAAIQNFKLNEQKEMLIMNKFTQRNNTHFYMVNTQPEMLTQYTEAQLHKEAMKLLRALKSS
jgi:hypothetical protein